MKSLKSEKSYFNMMLPSQPLSGKTALITGGAARLGAMSARYLHAAGAHVVIHYRSSVDDAEVLQQSLLEIRPDSASLRNRFFCMKL